MKARSLLWRACPAIDRSEAECGIPKMRGPGKGCSKGDGYYLQSFAFSWASLDFEKRPTGTKGEGLRSGFKARQEHESMLSAFIPMTCAASLPKCC